LKVVFGDKNIDFAKCGEGKGGKPLLACVLHFLKQ
jgi:hypothetical protein